VVWVNVDGLGDEGVLSRLGNLFNLHRLALEDVVNVSQRPKVEPYEGHLFMVSRMIHYEGPLETEQISFFVGENYVLTFQEYPGDCFDLVRQRIKSGQGIMRHAGPGYLAYALVDALVDAYFPVLEVFGERLEDLEDEVIARPASHVVGRIHVVKRELLALRRSMWPQREAVNALLRDESPYINRETRIYLRDCYDHSVQLLDIIETYREFTAGLMEAYLSSLSNRMNEIMKVLAIFASIFAPLTFITGIYGMNLMMPEQTIPWAYPSVLALMAAIAGLLLVYFRRRGWLGGSPPPALARRDRDDPPQVQS
jgi:magnesium transporter